MNTEAADLADAFVRILKAIPTGKQRDAALAKFRPSPPATLASLLTGDLEHNAPALTAELSAAFQADPSLAGKLWDTQDWPRPFWLVLRDELKQIAYRRNQDASKIDTQKDLYKFVEEQELLALAFSGGGIRSATFNLGVLQGLAESKLLEHVDILSTVSGGGYIGGFYALWKKRLQGQRPLQDLLSPNTSRDPGASDLKPIRFLRQFSNYLTPALGLLSLDTWTLAAIYLRNVALNQVTLISAFGAILLLPRLIGASSGWFPLAPKLLLDGPSAAVGLILFILSVASVAYNLRQVTRHEDPSQHAAAMPLKESQGNLPGHVQLFAIFPLLIGILIGSTLAWKYRSSFTAFTEPKFLISSLIFFASLSLIISLVGGFVRCFRRRLTGNGFWRLAGVLLLITVVTSATATALLRAYFVLLQTFSDCGISGIWHALVWGPPALLTVFAASAVLQVGLMGVDFEDSGREWLSRFRAVLNLYILAWLGLFGAAVYGPLLLALLGNWVMGLGAAWIMTTAGSVLAAKSSRTGQSKSGAPTTSPLDLIAKIGPPVFLVGFVLVISYAIHLLLAHPVLTNGYGFPQQISRHWTVFNRPIALPDAFFNGGDWIIAAPGSLFVALLVTAIVFVLRIDVNEFSMHHFYKNRLVRCYLGASAGDTRNPNPFTGFDDADELSMTGLQASKGYQGPYHLINTTLNLSTGKQLAWQERKAASFIFTPCYAGFHLGPDSDHPGDQKGDPNLRFCAYRRTETYAYSGGIGLGTAMSISGAAADPNQGFNTSPTVAFLMTVFDVRLGWWLGNPRWDKESKMSSPTFGLAELLGSSFGLSDDRGKFVSLSDGGHFDNMGIYELVRRRCKFIILCDAEQDGEFTFGGLGMAIRKCRVDFGAEIKIDPERIIPSTTTRNSDVHCAVGTIRYSDDTQGTLVYIKSSLTGDEPEDVRQYAATNPGFPHESTADQWFSESQFESYRQLGYHAVKSTLEGVQTWKNVKLSEPDGVTDLFGALKDHWYPVNPALASHGGTHTKTLNDLCDKIRGSKGLHQLGSSLFPEMTFPEELSSDPVAEYFFCITLIQLVEDIYVDFRLYLPEWHGDPRIEGWKKIFKTWKGVDRVKETWKQVSQTYRADFQRYWELL